MIRPLFRDRRHAGRILAAYLGAYRDREDVLVLALPRGGVPVAYEVARTFGAPLDIFLVRKLGVPGHEELAMGAIASGGARVLNEDVVRGLEIPRAEIERVTRDEMQELQRREEAYRNGRPAPEVRARTCLLIDDGLATGASMRAAVHALKRLRPAQVVIAVPVASSDICDAFRAEGEEVVCARTPEPFLAVGYWYQDFSQTTDEEVRELLARATAAPITNNYAVASVAATTAETESTTR